MSIILVVVGLLDQLANFRGGFGAYPLVELLEPIGLIASLQGIEQKGKCQADSPHFTTYI